MVSNRYQEVHIYEFCAVTCLAITKSSVTILTLSSIGMSPMIFEVAILVDGAICPIHLLPVVGETGLTTTTVGDITTMEDMDMEEDSAGVVMEAIVAMVGIVTMEGIVEVDVDNKALGNNNTGKSANH